MDLNAYLLDGVVDATTPPGEPESAARSRREAILAMFQAFEPANAMQAMLACHCITLQFLLNAAMRDSCDFNAPPTLLARSRTSVTSISRTLHQWVTKLETCKKRDATRAAEAKQPVQTPETAATPPIQTASMPTPKPSEPMLRVQPGLHAPPLNGHAAASVVLPVDVMTPEGLASIRDIERYRQASPAARQMTA